MSKRQRHQEKVEKQTRVSTPARVEMLSDETGIRFIVHFSFEIPQGRNNFNDMAEVVDSEISTARQEILKKVAGKLGVAVNFVD